MGEDFTRDEKHLAKGWDESEKVVAERSNSLFLKLEDGKSTLLNVVGVPEVFETTFPGADAPSTRIRVDVYAISEKKLLTWEMSKTVFEQLKRHRSRRPDEFKDAVLELGRTGTGKETKYWMDYVRQLTGDERELRSVHNIPF